MTGPKTNERPGTRAVLRDAWVSAPKVRVGANSPSLWPTMASEMYTGTCLRPSWTAMVCPTMSGMIVERRDQVRITRLSRLRFSSSIFFSRWSSTNGPFFRLRVIPSALSPCGGGGR